jgi:hypothetical protein
MKDGQNAKKLLISSLIKWYLQNMMIKIKNIGFIIVPKLIDVILYLFLVAN